jgi:SAM-dependent methyltransferase
MPAYQAFAGLYDALMDDVDYDAWAGYYLALIGRMGVTPRSLCDCACGTGAMSVRFARQGMRVTGVDLSVDMLELARRKALQYGVQVMFVCQDMCRLALPRPVDALVCACDGVNYLLDDDRLRAFFTSARKALKPGGALAFDISSAFKLRQTLGNNFFGEDRDDVAYLWSNRFDEAAETVTMDLTFFTREADGRYRRFDELHVQKAHEPEHLLALLAECGFSGAQVFGDRNFNFPDADEARIHFAAIRE